MAPGRPKSGKTTMQDIADRLDISKVSVSKALNGKTGISNELRRSILTTAQEMGYDRIPAEAVHRFAFIVSKHFFLETDAFYSEMYYRFSYQCLEIGASATLIIVSNGDEENLRLPAQLQMEEFSGIAVAGELSDEFLHLLEKPGRPLVFMDFESHAVCGHSILTDNYHWASIVTQKLVDLGHRKIGFVGQPGATHSITDRFFGYRRTLLNNHLPFRDEWVLVNNETPTGLYTSSIALPEEMPTAFVCHCDMAAHYLLATLNEHGYECPKDVSIISFDNTRLAETCCPALTSVGIDTRAFARQALELLTNEALRRASSRIYLPASLVERSSVVPVKES